MAVNIYIDSNCQPTHHQTNARAGETVNIHNQSDSQCTIRFSPDPGPFNQNPVSIPKKNSNGWEAIHPGTFTYAPQCGTGHRGTAGDGDPIIIVDPPMGGSRGHEQDDYQKKK